MFKSKKIVCIVTGKPTTYAGEFLQKKILEYGDEATLDKLYICKEVKALLRKGYKIGDIRKILNVPADTDLIPKEICDLIEKDYQKSFIKLNDTSNEALSTITTLTCDSSDEDVENFINTYIISNK